MKKTAVAIVSTLQKSGYEALFAGGCVRDQLLGKTPGDYDIATSATPDEVIKLFPNANTVGAHFGVVLVKKGGIPFEIATFRTDGNYTDGRRPDSVSFSTAEEDASRRDFTVNGIFLDPVSGELIDYVNGQADLEAQLIRAIGEPDDRFSEDYLRMLRAVRFATTLGFEIEEGTMRSIKSLAHQTAQIAPERIKEELNKIWLSPNRQRGFDLLVETGLMKAVLPEILVLQGCEQPPQWHPEGDVFTHTRLMLGHLPDRASLPLVLSVLFHDIAKPATYTYDKADDRIRFNGHDKLGSEMAVKILKRLRYSNEVIAAVEAAVANHMKFRDVQQMRTATLKRFIAKDRFDDELELHRVDCAGSNQNFDNYDFVREKITEFENEPLMPKRFVNGRDLIERGWKAGPGFGELLEKAFDLQLENEFENREQAIAWLDQQTPDY